MTEDTRRVPLLPKELWTERARDLFAVLEGPEARERGPRFEIILQLAQAPDLTVPFLEYNKHILFSQVLDPKVREIATLYVAWTCKSDYEWLSHVREGLQVGLDASDIEACKVGPASPHWSPDQRDVLSMVDEMRDSYDIGDALWARLSKQFNPQELMTLLFTVGNYIMFSGILNAIRAKPEGGAAGEDLAKTYGRPSTDA